MPYLNTDSITLHYQQHSPDPAKDLHPVSDTPILLLAGMASDSASWQPVIGPLSTHYHLITVDNRCTGRTSPTPVVTSRTHMMADIHALLQSLDVPKVTLLGHSMGALLAWQYASTYPRQVHAVIAASAALCIHPARVDLFKSLANLRSDDNEAHWYRVLLQFLFSRDMFADADNVSFLVEAAMNYPYKQNRHAFAAQSKALATFLQQPETSNLSCPALALTGDADKLFPPAELSSVYKPMKNVQTRIIKNAAHALHWENSDDFCSAVLEFLKQTT